jgi:hypothetical protein
LIRVHGLEHVLGGEEVQSTVRHTPDGNGNGNRSVESIAY